MDIRNYQETIRAGYTNPPEGSPERVFNLALGMCGEAGEVADCLKKLLRTVERTANHRALREHLREEIGDLMWYTAQICNEYEFNMALILKENLTKTVDRYNVDIERWWE